MNKENWMLVLVFIALVCWTGYEGFKKFLLSSLQTTNQEQKIDNSRMLKDQHDRMEDIKRRQEDLMRSNREKMRDMRR